MNARALVIEHGATVGPGTFAEWLPAAGVELDIVRPYLGDVVPTVVGPGTSGHAALIVMGGKMGAYDDDEGRPQSPWLPDVKELLRLSVASGLPVLGVCLGGQLLAEACGGRVQRCSAGPEIGTRLVYRRDVSAGDPLFGSAPFTPLVVQWHSDEIVQLPPGAVLLASSPAYAHQAFRVGERAWGLQFHVETPAETVRSWAADDDADLRAAGLDPDRLVAEVVEALPEIAQVWRPVLERFAMLTRTTLTRTHLTN